jgi:hypothetical protein
MQSRESEGRTKRKRSEKSKKFEKHRRMSSVRGETGEEAGCNTNHVTPQFLIVIQKQSNENISTAESAVVGKTKGLYRRVRGHR